MADGAPEGIDSPCADAPQVRLEFGERHLDRGQVGRVWRQEQELGAALFEHGGGFGAFVAGEVVEDDDIAEPERGRELGFDPGLENPAVHRPVD